jgi:DNA-binding NarL/FixJ family response regulator
LIDAQLVTGTGSVDCLRQLLPGAPVVAYGIDRADSSGIRCVEASVDGFIAATANVDELASVLMQALAGGAACSPSIAGQLLKAVLAAPSQTRVAQKAGRITGRERRILDLVAVGASNKRIAMELGISLSTVKAHMHSILTKTGAGSRHQLATRLSGDCGSD